MLMDNQNIINEIRNRINIVDVVSEYVSLSKKGENYIGLCPFHNDNHPSMSVSEKKQIYTCFSCHNSGNVFTFYQNINNVDFRTALVDLGKRVGIEVGNSSSKSNSYTVKYSKYYEVYDLASKYYELMINTDSGKKAREYLKNRGIDKDTIKEFGIGFATNDKDKLIKYFKEKKIDINTLNDLGLANNDIDTFIDRIVFPLDDRNGRIVGFSGRVYDKKVDMAKYINTKETPIFKKGLCLYHYNASKEHVRLKKYVIVMEGFMDVIRASTIGIKNTVALMGTALTDDQISLIKKLSQNVYLCLDGDNPGQNADLHDGELLEKAGLNVKVVCLTDDEDPDSYILKNGKESFEALIENAVNYSDFRIERLRNGVNFNSDLELSEYVNKVLREVVAINDEIRREIILKKLATETDLSYNTLEKKLLELASQDKTSNNAPVKREDKRRNKYERASLEFIYYMLFNERAVKIYDSKKLFFINSSLRALAGEISYYYHNYGNIVIADFYTYLSDKKELLDPYTEIINLELNEDVNDETLNEYAKVISDYNVREDIKRLEDDLRKEPDELKKAMISEKIRKLRIGESQNE